MSASSASDIDAPPSQSKEPNTSKPSKKGMDSKWKITLGGLLLSLFTFCCGGIVIAGLFTITSSAPTPITASTQIAVTNVDVTQIGITQLAVTQVIAGPTYTLLPTYTFPPTPEPAQILITPTFPPDFTEMYRFKGSGQGTTDLFRLPTGIIRVKWTHTGTFNFILYLKRLDNDSQQLIENAIGNADGQSVIKVGESDQFLFEILSGDGPWEIIVEYRPG